MVSPFSRCGRWITERKFASDWSLPDQLAYSTVSALLKLAAIHSEYRGDVMVAITTFTYVLVNKLQDSPRECLLFLSHLYYESWDSLRNTYPSCALIPW